MTITTDTAKLPLLLGTLKLPTISRIWPEFCAMANKEGWSAERLLTALCELELSEREQRRVQRHLAAARLPQGKTLDSFDFSVVPTLSKAQVNALAEGDIWLRSGHNLLAFGPPGVGKTHIAAAIGYELVQRGHRVPDEPDIRSGPAVAGRTAKSQPRAGDPQARQVRSAHTR